MKVDGRHMGNNGNGKKKELLEALGINDPLKEIFKLRAIIEFAIAYLESEGDRREPTLATAIELLRAALKPNGNGNGNHNGNGNEANGVA